MSTPDQKTHPNGVLPAPIFRAIPTGTYLKQLKATHRARARGDEVATAIVITLERLPPALKLWRNESLRVYHHRCPDVGGFTKLERFPIGHPDASV